MSLASVWHSRGLPCEGQFAGGTNSHDEDLVLSHYNCVAPQPPTRLAWLGFLSSSAELVRVQHRIRICFTAGNILSLEQAFKPCLQVYIVHLKLI